MYIDVHLTIALLLALVHVDFKMLLTRQYLLLYPLTLSLTKAQISPPAAPTAAIQAPQWEEQAGNIILKSLRYDATQLGHQLYANSSPAKVKRMLLGRQYTCDDDYWLCDSTQEISPLIPLPLPFSLPSNHR